MRRVAISCCAARMRALSSGLPSVSFCSSFTSCFVMRSRRLYCQAWNGTSTAAMRISTDESPAKLKATSQAAFASPTSTESRPRLENSSASPQSRTAATAPTRTNFPIALASSDSPFQPKTRFMPVTGLSFSMLNFSPSTLNAQPPNPSTPASAAITSAIQSGAISPRASPRASPRRTGNLSASMTSPRSRSSPNASNCSSLSARNGRMARKQPAPASITRVMLSSRDRGTCPR